MNSDMNSPAGQQSTGTATHPPTAAVTAARAAVNEAAGKAGLEAVQTVTVVLFKGSGALLAPSP